MTARRALFAILLLAGACTGGDGDAPATTEPETASTTAATTTTTAAADATADPEPSGPPPGPVAAPVRHPASARPIYFVMPDRFANGDPGNDTAGLDGGPLVHGFDPTGRGWHHGGDLIGLRERLPYLADLGIGAIWITPPFTNRFVQGDGTRQGSSSSYHGYWQIDWDRVDPHLGTDEDLRDLVAAAHAKDIDIYLDIVVNHTGDVITYAEDSFVYWSTSARPYRDAAGNEFDPAEVVATGAPFPPLDAATSFPYTPVFANPGDAEVKSPAWLNDPTLYHNRGNSTFQGESELYGDFVGLDDLFTEHPRVVDGMIELYEGVIERFGVDGFRVDTMKHVNPEFWARFAPAMVDRAASLGIDDFYLYGEVFSTDPIEQSALTNLGVPATLDFILDRALQDYVVGGSADRLVQAFDEDDWFTDADNNASMQVTFFGNHDEGRMGHLIDRRLPGADDAELLARTRLAIDILFTSRGTPVIYYGDEQGFTGSGGDQLARQDMFPSQTPEYLDDDLIGTDATHGDDNFDPDHPLYRHIQGRAALRDAHPALVTGAHLVHEPVGPVFALSRIDRDERVEYLVLTNANGSLTVPARVATFSPDTTFIELGGARTVTSDGAGEVLVEVDPLTTVILRAERPLPPPAEPVTVDIVRPRAGAVIPTARYRLQAELGDRRFAEVTFAVAVDGGPPEIVGVDDTAPYRVYWPNDRLPAGTPVRIIATVDDGSGRLRSASVDAVIGDR